MNIIRATRSIVNISVAIYAYLIRTGTYFILEIRSLFLNVELKDESLT